MARLEAFWSVACDHLPYLWLGAVVVAFLLLLNLLALAWAPRGTASFTIALVNLAMVGALGVAVGGMLLTCRRRRASP